MSKISILNDYQGLNELQVKERLTIDGYNELASEMKKKFVTILIRFI